METTIQTQLVKSAFSDYQTRRYAKCAEKLSYIKNIRSNWLIIYMHAGANYKMGIQTSDPKLIRISLCELYSIKYMLETHHYKIPPFIQHRIMLAEQWIQSHEQPHSSIATSFRHIAVFLQRTNFANIFRPLQKMFIHNR